MLRSLKVILDLAEGAHLEDRHREISSRELPGSINSITTLLNLDPITRTFVCCPSCFCCYDPTDYPESCAHAQAPHSDVCGTKLRTTKNMKGKRVEKPVREFRYQEFTSWLARFLCRPDIEKLVDRDVYQTGASPGEMHDIWDSPTLREFAGHDGQRFVGPNDREGRYVFSLCMDGFNPFHNKAAGKKYSAGAIYMVCLNLPPALRYRPENIYLACVFPGPHEPSMEQINHVLRPLIDDLLKLWHPGVFLSKTLGHPSGRLVRCALVPVVCDLPALHSVTGIGQFCLHKCQMKTKDIDDLDMAHWPPAPSWDEHKRLANQWLELPTVKERDAFYRKHLIRYSELLRLPYWDPTRFIMIDTMHNLLLGNLERHCRELWGMDFAVDDGDGLQAAPKPSKRELDSQQVANAWSILHHGTDQELVRCSAEMMRELCTKAGLLVSGRHGFLLGRLRQYVSLLLRR